MKYNPCDERKDPTFRKAVQEQDKPIFRLAWVNPKPVPETVKKEIAKK